MVEIYGASSSQKYACKISTQAVPFTWEVIQGSQLVKIIEGDLVSNLEYLPAKKKSEGPPLQILEKLGCLNCV